MYIARYLNVESLVASRSVLLFGPRSTGKSTLVKQTLTGNTEILPV